MCRPFGVAHERAQLHPIRARLVVVTALLLAAASSAPAASAQGGPASQPPPSESAVCRPLISVDSPVAGAAVSTSALVRGWALDMARPDGRGINQVHLYLDGEAGTGAPLGAASLGQFRPDVDAAFARPSSQSGWTFAWDLADAAPGLHALYVYVQDSCGWSFVTLPLTVSATAITVDRPAPDARATDGQALSVAGWALDPGATSGSGVDAVHVYVDGEAGRGPAVGAAAIGLPRADVAIALQRPASPNAGFSLDARLSGALPGPHTLYVYAHSSRQGWSYRSLSFALAEAPIQRPILPAGRLFPGGASGFSIAWPQCGEAIPARPFEVAVVGATGGRAFYQNPCLASQFAWARAASVAPGLYMNVNAPAGRTAPRGLVGPAGGCRPEEQACLAFNYGYNAALNAVAYALSQGAMAPFWWLDVETENTWFDDRALNARVIQGAIDGLRAQGLTVGIYSTAYQWNEIAGSFSPGLPLWVAGARSRSDAPRFCAPTAAFGGGTVMLVQYPNDPFSGEYAC